MSDSLTSTSLIRSVERRAHVPTAQETFTPQDFLDFATEELRLTVCPMIMSVHEDYFLFSQDIPLEANKSKYEIPSRAMGNKLRDVQYKLGDGNYLEMTRIGIGDRFNSGYAGNAYNGLKRFYIENNKVCLMDKNESSNSASLTMVFYIKSSKLVPDAEVAFITSINRMTGEIAVSSVPEKFSTTDKYDFYKHESPYNVLKIDFSITGINSTTKSVTVNPDNIPSDLVVGDHLALAGECCIPQVPSELHPLVAQSTACRVLEAQGDTEGLTNANTTKEKMMVSAGILTDNRVDDAPQKLVNRYSLTRITAFAKNWNR